MGITTKPLRQKEFDPSIVNFLLAIGLLTAFVLNEWSLVIVLTLVAIVFFAWRFTITLNKGKLYRAIAYGVFMLFMMAFFWEAMRPKHW